MTSLWYDSAWPGPALGNTGDASDARDASSSLVLDAAGGDEEVYDLRNRSGRRAIIFRCGGSDADCERLINTLEKLSFTVDVREELNEESFANEKEKKLDCLLIIVLAHDKENDALSTRGSATLKSEMWSKFMANNWTTLAGKPKIFIIQNCTGENMHEQLPPMEIDTSLHELYIDSYIPAEADLLVYTVTTRGGCSKHRGPDESNIFIEELCKEFDKSSKDDLLTMLTRVNDEFFHDAQEQHNLQYSKMPSITSTLRKKIYFHDERNSSSASEDTNDCYLISRCPVGKAIIFNNEIYDKRWRKMRRGTQRDCDNLKETLQTFNFIVEVIDNPKKRDVKKTLLREAKSEDHKQYDCLIVVILTHGGKEGNLTAYNSGDFYNVVAVWSTFLKTNCPSLASKPKIFIFQACRGPGTSDRVSEDGMSTQTIRHKHVYINDKLKVPSEPDFVLAYSTFDDKVSARDKYGTWYIAELCEELKCNWKDQDLLSMLTRAHRRVARLSRYHSKLMCPHKQMPTFTSTLTKKIYFNGDGSRPNVSSTSQLRTDIDEDRRTTSGVGPKDSPSGSITGNPESGIRRRSTASSRSEASATREKTQSADEEGEDAGRWGEVYGFVTSHCEIW